MAITIQVDLLSIFHEKLLTNNSDNSSATNAKINLKTKKLPGKKAIIRVILNYINYYNSDNSIATNVNLYLIKICRLRMK